MKLFAIADLHLCISTPEKSMAEISPVWNDYVEKIGASWKKIVGDGDLVAIAGDITWAKNLERALIDLAWIDSLPGTKIFLEGNHDYWWPSNAKLKALPFKTLHFITGNALHFGNCTFGGSRLWDGPFGCESIIEFKENPKARLTTPQDPLEKKKIWDRELLRLRRSLEQLSPSAKYRICLTHYPPLPPDLASTEATAILEEFAIQKCIFGHLHSLKQGEFFGEKNGIDYILTSADYLAFAPKLILEDA